MIFYEWSNIALVITLITSLTLLISQRWQVFIFSLSLQYLMIFWFTAMSWPLGLASVKLIVGLTICSIIGASQPDQSELDFKKHKTLSSMLFRLIAAMVVWVFCFSIAPELHNWLATSTNVLIAGSILIAMGILQLGMTTNILRVFTGLLTIISGFEILYASAENSVLVAGLLAITNLGLGLVCAYLLLSPTMEESQ